MTPCVADACLISTNLSHARRPTLPFTLSLWDPWPQKVMLEERRRFRKAGVIRLRSQNAALQLQLESSRRAHSAAVEQIEAKKEQQQRQQHERPMRRMGSDNRSELLQVGNITHSDM